MQVNDYIRCMAETPTLTDSEFESLSAEFLEQMFDVLEPQLSAVADVDLAENVLTIEFESGRQFLLNKHLPNRQIWLSSPFTGGWHFNWTGYDWVASKNNERLGHLLMDEFKQAGAGDVRL